MNVYPVARNALLRGDVDMLTDTISCVITGPAFVYDPNDAFLSDTVGTLVIPVPVAITDIVAGEVKADPVTFASVGDGVEVTGILTFQTGPAPESSLLLCWADRRADAVPLDIIGNGGDLTFQFDYLLKI